MNPETQSTPLLRLQRELSAHFLERDEVIEGLLCALVAGQHVLLLGPPGTAKSELSHELCRRIEGARYFQWLLTRFTTPEELFGPISLKALEQDRYVRVTEGKLPRAHVAFLDEVFKASSSILNTLLAILNERRFDGGDGSAEVPLCTLVGAANELPDDDELGALYDRFLLRYQVEYVKEDYRFLHLLASGEPDRRTFLPLAELEALRARARAVEVPDEILRDVTELRRLLAERELFASDRRWRQSIDLLRARAVVAGRDRVGCDDLDILAHVLWTEPSERAAVEESLRQLAHGHEDEAEKLVFQAREIAEGARGPHEDEDEADRATVEALAKLHDLSRKLEEIVEAARQRGRSVERVGSFHEEVRGMIRTLLAEESPEAAHRN
jgi:MoxR-like ATPase